MQTSKSLTPHVDKQPKKKQFYANNIWQCNTRFRPNITKIYAINTILANNMKENSEENNTKAVEIKGVFCIYLKILILATYVVLVDNHSNKV